MTLFKTAIFISKIIYPKCNPIWFLIYMYLKYYSVIKRQTKYSIRTLPDNVLWSIVKGNSDINNCVIVHPDDIYPGDIILSLYHTKPFRKVFVIRDSLCKKQTLYMSNTVYHNSCLNAINCDIKLIKFGYNVAFAQEIELCLIACPHDVGNTIIDAAVASYFKLPKLICKGDIVSINMKHFCEPSFYTNTKLNLIESVNFKCRKVVCGGREVVGQYFCVIGHTTIAQSANIQSFLPRVEKIGTRMAKSFSEVAICPYGLRGYLDQLEVAIYPFINKKRNLKLRPIFLLQGKEGCGQDILIEALALKSGMHYYRIYNSDLSANVYAQNESKLNNAFFAAKMSAPCIVSLHKFQNFGKNSEGHFDQRLINSFIDYLDHLLDNNKFPVILFCCSNSSDIPAEFKRVFLEIFDVNAPNGSEREDILKWLIEKNNIKLHEVNLEDVSNKTHGFYFEDLSALVYYAEINYFKTDCLELGVDDVILNEEHFEEAIDHMQSNYNQSLGAPKVPKVQWSDVGGLNEVKQEIIKTINFPLKHPQIFQSSGLTRSGILLYGPPGTGKTLIAKAVATECGLCFLTVKGPELLNMYVGQSEQNIREVFDRARQASPCIIFFDELDSLAPNRGLSGDSGGVMDRVVSQLLAEMDGLESTGKVFVIGATNRPDLIDPALLRPGRFDKLLYVGPCTDLESKTLVLQALIRKFKLAKEVDLQEIVRWCPQNITGADFYGICSSAWTLAAKRLIKRIENGELSIENLSHKDVIVHAKDFKVAIKNVKPSISEEDLKYFDTLKRELSSNDAK